LNQMPGKTKKSAKTQRSYKTKTYKGKKKSSRNSLLFEKVPDEIERKNTDAEMMSISVPLTSSFSAPTLINGIAQGTTGGSHIGRKVVMKNLLLRYTVTANSTVSQARIIVVYDKQVNTITPVASDIVEVNAFYSPLKLACKDRFVVLLDELTPICPSTTQNVSGKRYVKFNLPVTFNSNTAATVSAIQTGAVWLIVANNSDPSVGATSNFYGMSRIRFTDE